MNVKPLHNNVLFKFLDETRNGYFVEKRLSGIIVDLGKNHKYSSDMCRLGVVEAVGPEVTIVKVGDTIAIKALMWTAQIEIEGQRVSMTEEKHIIGICA